MIMKDILPETKEVVINKYKEFWSQRKTSEVVSNILELKITRDNVKDILVEAWLVLKNMKDDIKTVIDEDRKKSKEKREEHNIKSKYKELQIQIDNLEDWLELLTNVSKHKPKYYKIEQTEEKGEATALWNASDWHIEERVDWDTINWHNEYNPTIAEFRAKNFFKNALRLTNICAKDTEVKNVVIWILWDMFSWYIHEELMESNYMSPTEAMNFLDDLLDSWFKYILENSNYNFTIICKDGNHTRTTPKIRVSTRYKNSLEYFLFGMIAKRYKDNPRMNFIVEKWIHTYFKVYNKTIRYSHWDMIKFWWWVWGITIPVNKAINQFNKIKWADLDIFWHFHQTISSKNFMCNWSLKWYDSYALSIKADFEEPQQTFCLINQDWKKTLEAPIFLDK